MSPFGFLGFFLTLALTSALALSSLSSFLGFAFVSSRWMILSSCYSLLSLICFAGDFLTLLGDLLCSRLVVSRGCSGLLLAWHTSLTGNFLSFERLFVFNFDLVLSERFSILGAIHETCCRLGGQNI